MKHVLPLTALLLLASPVFAADPAPSCVEDKIAVQKLILENSTLKRQLLLLDAQFSASLQLQFRTEQQSGEAAKTEQIRLEGLLKKPAEKSQK